jgi:hypothetical protein
MMICLNLLVQNFEGHSFTVFCFGHHVTEICHQKNNGYASFAMNFVRLHHIYRNDSTIITKKILQILSIFQQKIGKFLNFFVPPNNSNNSNNWGGGGYFHPKKLYEKIGGKNTYP